MRESLARVSGMPSCSLGATGRLIRKLQTLHMGKLICEEV